MASAAAAQPRTTLESSLATGLWASGCLLVMSALADALGGSDVQHLTVHLHLLSDLLLACPLHLKLPYAQVSFANLLATAPAIPRFAITYLEGKLQVPAFPSACHLVELDGVVYVVAMTRGAIWQLN